MKTKLFFATLLLMLPMIVLADDPVVIHPSSGEGFEEKELTGYDGADKALYIDKRKFSDAVIGNAIKVSAYGISDGAKLYVGDYSAIPFPGSDERVLTSTEDQGVWFYLTESMLYEILHGDNDNGRDCRIWGNNLKVNRVEIYAGKAGSMNPFRTVWTGSYAIDSWTTLNLQKQAFENIDLSKMRVLRLYHDAGRTDNITFNIFADDFVHKIAGTDALITVTSTYADLVLTDELRTSLSGLSTMLYVQGHKESGAAFNLTDVVLVPFSPEGCDNCFYVY